jgi:hypothetical protein
MGRFAELTVHVAASFPHIAAPIDFNGVVNSFCFQRGDNDRYSLLFAGDFHEFRALSDDVLEIDVFCWHSFSPGFFL